MHDDLKRLHQIKIDDLTAEIKNLKEQNKTLNTQLELLKQAQQDSDDEKQRVAELDRQKVLVTQVQSNLEKAKMEHEMNSFKI